ncbi:MAG: UvrD-helicase domain-containing protein [Flavobacteriaceae bacterium]|nr:UvrD-helicase domain-containing protein [Flavobacteriaceae bacterium]
MQNQTSFQVYNASAGSGKTFTLVKEYIKILLQSDNYYLFQKILAITFTNKAAGEMKERILKNLQEFSKLNAKINSNDMFEDLVKETGLSRDVLQKRSKNIIQSILKNYTAFHIKTIDSFTNKLIKSFAFDLGLSLDFEVELDIDSILKETIDVIISKIGIDKELTNILVEFAKQKTLEDKSWDISRELFDISKLLLNENHANEIRKLESKSISDFKSLEKKLKQKQIEIEKEFVEIGKNGQEIIADLGIEDKDFYYRDLPNFFKKIIKIKDLKPSDLKFEGRLNRAINEGVLYGPKKNHEIKAIIDSVADELIQLYFKAENLYNQKYAIYQLNKLILKNLIPLAILNSISKALEEIKTDNNIRLNAEFNQIISKHLREEPAAFIYEKLGEKFKHYFIDEMQDTSVLQWENLIPLIDNALSEENSSLLLVGDAKQAIYRWRGGKAEQFIDLSIEGNTIANNPFQVYKELKNLEINYRSYSEIVNFNNHFFIHISKYLKKEAYQNLYQIGNRQKYNKKEGGYVQLSFVEECINVEERDEVFPEKVYETILNLESKFDRNEICILVRKKINGIAIANYLTEKGVDIVSSETLLIKNNNKVDFIINLLSFLKDKDNDDARFNVLEFLYHHLQIQDEQHDFIQEIVKLETVDFFKALEKYQIFYSHQNFNQSPFYEAIEEIIRSFNLTNESDAYLQFFLDFIFEFVQKKSQKSIDFLAYWEQKKEKLSIVASNNKNAVQIMTIHKSKGLEFPVVIFPYDLDIYRQLDPKAWFDNLDRENYNGFESILVSAFPNIENTGDYGKQIYKEQQEELELDNFNLLYVTLTRAKEQLYIISENREVKDKPRLYSHFFIDFLKTSGMWEEDKLVYEFGESSRLSKKEKEVIDVEIQQSFISTSWQDHQINIVANSSLLWDTERGEAIRFGNLIHEMMSKIISEKDIENTIIQFINKGFLEKKKKGEIKSIILSIVNHEQLKAYFQEDSTVMNEREILTEDKQILIPDRLIFNENKVTIIDYKTGKPDKKHQYQIESYASVLQNMNFVIDEKLLVYIDDKIEVLKV